MLIIIFVFTLLIIIYGPHLWAKQLINKYSKDEYFSGTGYDLARILLDRMEMNHVHVEKTDVGDYYNPENKTIFLSKTICGKKSLAAVTVAAHEVGHAIQDHVGYKPLYVRNRMIITATKFQRLGAGILIALPFVTLITRIPATGIIMFLSGLATLGIPIVVHILTLPTEFDASFNRALPILATKEYIPQEDLPAARKILLACALTYVTSALVDLLNVFRWIRIIKG